MKGILAINSEKHLFEYLPDDPIWPIRFRPSRLDSSADIAKASFLGSLRDPLTQLGADLAPSK